MKKTHSLVVRAAALALTTLAPLLYAEQPELIVSAPAPQAPPAAAAAKEVGTDAVALRIRFGQKDEEPTNWSGSIDVSAGVVGEIRGWRWQPGDFAKGSAWTVETRRQRPQDAPKRQQQKQEGKQWPVQENGVIINLTNTKPDAAVTIKTEPGNVSFKLSDLADGKKIASLNGNLQIERVPLVQGLAESQADEDYPVVATAKDGTIWVAYLAFTRGKDFQGGRERVSVPGVGSENPIVNGTNVRKIERPEDFEYLRQKTGGEQLYLRSYKDGKWSDPIAVTDGKTELYRPSIAIDGSGKVWVFYPAQLNADQNSENGNWELLARSYDPAAGKFGDVQNLSNAPGTDFFNVATTDSNGRVWLAWVGARGNSFNVFTSHQTDAKAVASSFTPGQRVSQATGNEWEPALAADRAGNVTVAWDTYDKGDYDIYLAKKNADDTFGAPTPVAASLNFEVRPSLAYDSSGKLWIAWEQSGEDWGKDFGALKKKGIPLYSGNRAIGLKVLDSAGQWYAPAAFDTALGPPPSQANQNANAAKRPAGLGQQARARAGVAPAYPRVLTDDKGQVFLAFRGRQGGNVRVGVGSVWYEYLTKLNGDAWLPAAWVPRSNNILDNRPALALAPDGTLQAILSGDGRGDIQSINRVANPHLENEDVREDAQTDNAVVGAGGNQNRKRGAAGVGPDPNNDLYVASISTTLDGVAPAPALTAIAPETVAQPTEDTKDERAAVQVARDFRTTLNGENLRLWRGEFHRHTELSPDGGGDGSLLDMWRYGVDAAAFDWIGDGDHDYGNGREYSWWTTQKAVTLFTVPGRFTPVYSYERSVSYPEGHRNVMFATRGIRSLPRLPLSDPNVDKPAPDTELLYKYLHYFNGITAAHTSATDMGTDWRNNDPIVEPFVEIYQGDRNNYERPDAPRSAVREAELKQSTPERESFGGYRPKGFVNLALLKGYRLAFQSSSDHISTHLSYCNVLVTEPTRQGIIDAIKKRRVYGATDNIVADVRVKAGGVDHLFGEEFSTDQPPTLNVHLIGARTLANVVIIKDDKVVYESKPNAKDVKFDWTDPNPTKGKTSYYYVRGEQVPDLEGSTGELVWVSPFWIKYEGK